MRNLEAPTDERCDDSGALVKAFVESLYLRHSVSDNYSRVLVSSELDRSTAQ